jgi:hypothetical protein
MKGSSKVFAIREHAMSKGVTRPGPTVITARFASSILIIVIRLAGPQVGLHWGASPWQRNAGLKFPRYRPHVSLHPSVHYQDQDQDLDMQCDGPKRAL